MRNLVSIDDQADHDLLRGKSVTYQHVAHQPASVLLIVRTDMILLHPVTNDRKDRLIHGSAEHTILHRDNAVCARRIEAGDHMAFLIRSDRKLCLIAVSVWLVHTDDRQHDRIHFIRCKSAEAKQIVTHLLLLECKLFSIRKSLNLTTSATSV